MYLTLLNLVKKLSKKLMAPFVLVMLGLFISGCTTYYGAAVIKTIPDGAQVYDMDDGSYIGVSTTRHVWLSRNTQRKFMNVRLHKEGYEDSISSFWLNLDYATSKGAAGSPQFVQFDLKPSAD